MNNKLKQRCYNSFFFAFSAAVDKKCVYDSKKEALSSSAIFMYRTRTIITRGLYTFYPFFEVQKRFFKGLFS